MEILSQNKLIKEHLLQGKRLTALDALRLFKCLRLSGRIHDLRHKEGLPIHSKMIIRSGKRVAEYYLSKNENHDARMV